MKIIIYESPHFASFYCVRVYLEKIKYVLYYCQIMLNKQTVENRGNFNISVSKVQAISLTVRTSHDVAEM